MTLSQKESHHEKHHSGVRCLKASIIKWCKYFRNECQNKSQYDPTDINEVAVMKENLFP